MQEHDWTPGSNATLVCQTCGLVVDEDDLEGEPECDATLFAVNQLICSRL